MTIFQHWLWEALFARPRRGHLNLYSTIYKMEEEGVKCELVCSIRNKVSANNSLVNEAQQHPTCSWRWGMCYLASSTEICRASNVLCLLTLDKSSFQLCQKPNSFAASAQNLCLLLIWIIGVLQIKKKCFCYNKHETSSSSCGGVFGNTKLLFIFLLIT